MFKIFSIGKIIKSRNISAVQISEEYIPALLNAGMFSHLLIFCGNKDNGIQIHIVKIIEIVQTKGLIYIDYISALNNTFIYDIKPYFPCEDRVRDSIPSDSVERPVYNDYSDRLDYIEKLKLNKTGLTLVQTGEFQKEKSNFIIRLNEITNSLADKLKTYSHFRVVWWFNLFDKEKYRNILQCNPPYENAPKTGIFSTRSPVRPNPIGLTTVKILDYNLNDKIINISNVDAFAQTPVIALIPYKNEMDRVKEFFVPKWVNHWSEWFIAETGNSVKRMPLLIESDSDRLPYSKKSIQTCNKFSEIKPEINSAKNRDVISVIGAREHNLKNITLEIPKNKISVVTGVSGSGKSSLVFDTVYAESQRRLMDSISTSGRQVFEQFNKPAVDQITGLPPAIAIEQKTTSRNPRSMVGTITEIYDYLRLLYSRIGIRHCPECGRAVKPLTEDKIIFKLLKFPSGTAFLISPFNQKDNQSSFNVPEANEESELFVNYKNELTEKVKTVLDTGKGALRLKINDNDELVLHTRQFCYHCNYMFFNISSSLFSFNHPMGICPECNGLGKTILVDINKIISAPEKSLLDGASDWWGNLREYIQNPTGNWWKGEIIGLANKLNVNLEKPWKDLPEDFKDKALYGSDGIKIIFEYKSPSGRSGKIERAAVGAVNNIKRLFKDASGESSKQYFHKFMKEQLCPICEGERLCIEARMTKVADKRYPQAAMMTLSNFAAWIDELPSKLTENEFQISSDILLELRKKSASLLQVGLDYLTLNRTAPTLSGGEIQRLRLATQLGCGLTNLLYVLDEPSIGLHPRDHNKLLLTLKQLRDEGNTLLIVEHDADTIRIADKLIDIGRGAGIYGGDIIAEGTVAEVIQNENSITGKYLKISSENKLNKTKIDIDKWITLSDIKTNNLKNITARFPIGKFICVTGVSGSGKSSLISQTLYPVLNAELNKNNYTETEIEYSSINGIEHIDSIINVTQAPIGRTPRSNPATYTGIYDEIRNLFAKLDESKKLCYKKNRFSFNSKEGACSHCNGHGRQKIEMHFMPDVWFECPECNGRRFNNETLNIRMNGKSIADILDMDIAEAIEFFKDNKKVYRILKTLHNVGLDYIKLGQSALTFSGGEAQRIKLAKELSKKNTGKTVYILDEPTTGLHFADINNLLKVIRQITKLGNTVIVIEHNTEVIRNADWLIDIGPDGGDAGGYIIAEGTPYDIASNPKSITGQYLPKSDDF